MKRMIRLLALLALPSASLAQNAAPSVSLKLEKASFNVGSEVKGVVSVAFGPGLHGYQNPPTESYMIPVVVKGADGTTLKSVKYPKGTMEMVAGVMSAVYSHSVDFPVVLVAPKAPGEAKFTVTFSYQQCDELQCYMPDSVSASATASLIAAPTPIDPTPPVVKPDPRTSPPAQASLRLSQAEVTAGASVTAELELYLPEGTFLFQEKGDQVPVSITASNGLVVSTMNADVFVKKTINGRPGIAFLTPVTVPVFITLPADAKGEQEIPLDVTYTLWNDEGPFQEQTTAALGRVTVTERAQSTQMAPPVATTSAPTDNESPKAGGVLGFVENALTSGNWLLIIPAALLAGLAMCLTPCVFPMIPVTVSFFANQGAKTSAGRFSLGFFYMLGIAVTYGAVGGVSAAAGGAVGALFAKPWFVLLLAALLIGLALSMFDVYEIRLPGFLQKNLKGRSGPIGAMIMGLLMGFAAAPCAGALVGAMAVKVAETRSIPTGLGFFGTIGIGMGLPFMVLATITSGAKSLPKSGGWLKTTKAVLGLVVLYFAAGYVFQGVGLRPGEASTEVAWMVVHGGFAAYLLFFDKSDATRAVGTIKGVAAVALGLLVGIAYSEYNDIKFNEELSKISGTVAADSQVVGKEINWIPYNDENFAKAVASGKPIMIDGKADWCTICLEVERGVFKTPQGLVALSGVYLMSIDWSTGTPDSYIKQTGERFKIAGLPHVVFMKPGGKEEFYVQEIKSVDDLKQNLRRAGAKI